MASRLKQLIRTFGVKDGVKFYAHIKINPSGWFYSSSYKTRFYLRPNTSDYYTFHQVFLENQYNITIPATPKTIIDAGANIGMASIYFAHRFPAAKIIAIEPSAENFKVLLQNVANIPQATLLCMGLWNRDTHLEILDTYNSNDSFTVREVSKDQANSIPAISISTLMEQFSLDRIDILKMDIEGSEKELFQENYESWLPQTKILLIELHDFMKKGCATSMFKALGKYNFSFSMKNENLVLVNEDLAW